MKVYYIGCNALSHLNYILTTISTIHTNTTKNAFQRSVTMNQYSHEASIKLL